MTGNILETLPESLQHEIQSIPSGLVIRILEDLVEVYKKRKTEYEEADQLIQQADDELSQEGISQHSPYESRRQFLELRNEIVSKYFRTDS